MLPSRSIAALQRSVGHGLAHYLEFVWRTSTIVHPPGNYPRQSLSSCIIATWHGQHFLAPFLREDNTCFVVPVAKGAFGSIYNHTFQLLGLQVVRGAHGKDYHLSGGFKVARQLLRALDEGKSVALTVDNQPKARSVGDGVIALAHHSGRPIVPLAMSARRRIIAAWRWDRQEMPLPFGRIVVVLGAPIYCIGRNTVSARHQLQEALDVLNVTADRLVRQ
jgi:lysophospholipid acyltransferase (LPLAT)-like uncharacterized protein